MSEPRRELCSKAYLVLALAYFFTERLILQELEEVPKKMKQKRGPGPDGVPNEMLQHLGSGTKCILLFIYSQNWSKGKVPTIWNKVLIRSIPEKGKEK